MRVLIAAIFLVLCLGTHCQQAITLENCVYSAGVVAADLSLVYKDKTNRQYTAKARADIQTLNDMCLTALPTIENDCTAHLTAYRIAVKAKTSASMDLLVKYHACMQSKAK